MSQSAPFSTEIKPTRELVFARRRTAGLCLLLVIVLGFFAGFHFPFRKPGQLLHVSFESARQVFSEIDASFNGNEKQTDKTRKEVRSQFAGSIQQTNGIVSGLVADIASFTTPLEWIQLKRAGVEVSPEALNRYPFGGSPFYSTIVWVVKPDVTLENNDWKTLMRSEVLPCMPDPNESGVGRAAYFSIRAGMRFKETTGEQKVFENECKLFNKMQMVGRNAPATGNWFLKTNGANLLITLESEAIQLINLHSEANLRMVYPDLCLAVEPVVIEITEYTQRRHTEETANRYIQNLYSLSAQTHFAQKGFRPRSPEVLGAHREQFPPIQLIPFQQVLGDWESSYLEAFGPDGHFKLMQQIRRAQKGGQE